MCLGCWKAFDDDKAKTARVHLDASGLIGYVPSSRPQNMLTSRRIQSLNFLRGVFQQNSDLELPICVSKRAAAPSCLQDFAMQATGVVVGVEAGITFA